MVIEIVLTVVKVTPSEENEDVNVEPILSIFTNFGTVCPAIVVLVEVPLDTVLLGNDTPLIGVITVAACVEFDDSVSRIMTPLFAQAWVLVSEVTLATIDPLPFRV